MAANHKKGVRSSSTVTSTFLPVIKNIHPGTIEGKLIKPEPLNQANKNVYYLHYKYNISFLDPLEKILYNKQIEKMLRCLNQIIDKSL